MKKLFDLRFVIGAFFCIIGILLGMYSLLSGKDGMQVNRICGIIFIAFGVIMLWLSSRGDKKNEAEPGHPH